MNEKDLTVKDVLICDDVRKEENNKLILVGVYAAGNIIILGDRPAIFPRFFFVIKIGGKKGEYRLKAILKDPDGKVFMDFPGFGVKIENEDLSYVASIGITGMVLEKLGTYSLEISPEQQSEIMYRFIFDVSQQKA
jgi:hypothetical protein